MTECVVHKEMRDLMVSVHDHFKADWNCSLLNQTVTLQLIVVISYEDMMLKQQMLQVARQVFQ